MTQKPFDHFATVMGRHAYGAMMQAEREQLERSSYGRDLVSTFLDAPDSVQEGFRRYLNAMNQHAELSAQYMDYIQAQNTR